jgi:hypothetical protein
VLVEKASKRKYFSSGMRSLSKKKRKKNPGAVQLGRLGGQARAKKLGAAQKSEIAKKAANKRWERQKSKLPNEPDVSS